MREDMGLLFNLPRILYAFFVLLFVSNVLRTCSIVVCVGLWQVVLLHIIIMVGLLHSLETRTFKLFNLYRVDIATILSAEVDKLLRRSGLCDFVLAACNFGHSLEMRYLTVVILWSIYLAFFDWLVQFVFGYDPIERGYMLTLSLIHGIVNGVRLHPPMVIDRAWVHAVS
jgi:hypothetical protein